MSGEALSQCSGAPISQQTVPETSTVDEQPSKQQSNSLGDSLSENVLPIGACEGQPGLMHRTLSNPSSADSAVHRLKVVGLPEGYSEDQLRSLFSLCGPVCEARLIADKATGRQVGYGYVSFSSKEAADLAISTFDDQLQLQGAANTLSVYYAKKQHDSAIIQDKESCPARNAKLYFCGTPSSFRRDSILALFSAFGRVRHLQVYTDSFGVLASGTVTMYSTEEATAAMDSLDGKVLQPGTAPLKVTWAQLSTLPRRNPAGGGPPPPAPKGFTVSYACLPTFVTPSEIAAMFERYGMVLQVVPFAHRREGPTNSRGCGLVVMDSELGGMAAMEALSGKFTWPGAERPLLVQPFYGVERVGPHQLPTLPEGSGSAVSTSQGPAGGGGGSRRWQPGSYNQQYSGRVGYGNGEDRARRAAAPGMFGDIEPAPPCCAPDAFKLVLANIPNSYAQSDVSALLQPYGQVMSVFREQSRDPNGDGTVSVWYYSGAQAEAALAGLRSVIVMAPGGPRKLAVRAVGYRGPAATQQTMHQQVVGGQYRNLGVCSAGSGGSIADVIDSPGASASPGMPPGVFNTQPQMVQYGSYTAAMTQQGLQMMGNGIQQGLDGSVMWQAPAATAPASAAAAITMQLAGSQLAQAAAANRAGSFDMQQLMYVLPSQQQQQQGIVVSGGMAANQAWPAVTAAQVLMASGNMMDQLQMGSDASTSTTFMAPSPGMQAGQVAMAPAAPPAGHYTGWLC